MLLNKAETTLIAYPSASGSITLPAITTIGDYAFSGCTALTTISLPAAQSIGVIAFYGCTALTSVSLPAAQSIGVIAFYGCTALTSVNLPAAPPDIVSPYGIFYYTGGSGTITITVPSTAAVSAYTSAWGVTAVTAANGNTGVYGDNHKAVTITAAP
jgi:hypothetical protein